MNLENNNNMKNSDTTFYSLNKIIGFGSFNNFSISVNSQNGLSCYITGPIITFYDLKKDKSIYYFRNMNNRAFNCLTFSENGNYLACGEGYCTKSEILIIDINKIPKGENSGTRFNTNISNNIQNNSLIKFTLKGGHKLSIEKLRFFKNDKYLISIGDREDKYMNIWNLDYVKNTYEIAFSMKYNRYIISFDISDRIIIMGGEKFLKIWTIDEKDNFNPNSNSNLNNALKTTEKDSTTNQGFFTINKFNIETGKLRDKIFNICKIQQKKTFILSLDGHLIELDNELKEISRWVNLKTDKALSLTIHLDNLFCGCSEGIIRIFSCSTLQYKSTLHRPPPLGKANIDSNTKKINISVTNDEKFADVICLVFNPFYEKLISLYSDKTFFIWDLRKQEKIYVYRYSTFHSGSINNMDCVFDSKEEVIHFVTCSDDKTVRLWNIKMEEFLSGQEENANKLLKIDSKKLEHIAYSKYCRRIFYFGKKYDHFKIKQSEIMNGLNKVGNPKYNELELHNITEADEDEEISFVKFSPDLKYLACGDNYGNLYIYDMKTLKQLNLVNLHNNQITCIDFFTSEIYKEKGLSSGSNNIYYLATGSLDNLVHIFDIRSEEKISQPFETLEKITLNDHEAPITGLIFNLPFLNSKSCSSNINIFNNSNNYLIHSVNLITFSMDHKIKFYCINSIKSIQLMQSFVEENLQTYSISWNLETNKIITGHNGKISVWKTYGCRPYKIFDVKLKNNVIEHFRIALDQTGKIIATSCNDKFIRIRSAFDGQLFCKIPIAESISSLSFCIKNEFLIASSIEGYVYFFRIDTESILNKIKISVEKQGGDEDDNDDYQSIQNTLKYQIYNKIKILEKLLQSEIEYSKKEQIKYLIEKMKNNEDLKIEDLRTLDSYYQENNRISAKLDNLDINGNNNGRNSNSNIDNFNNNPYLNNGDKLNSENLNINSNVNNNAYNNNSTSIHERIGLNPNSNSNKTLENEGGELLSNKSEIINLREDAETNKDEIIPESKEEEDNRNSYLTKSIMFEKGLKENISINNDLKKSIIPSNRVSLSDNYYSILVSNAPKSEIIKNIFKKAEAVNNNTSNNSSLFDRREQNNTKREDDYDEKKKSSEINNYIITKPNIIANDKIKFKEKTPEKIPSNSIEIINVDLSNNKTDLSDNSNMIINNETNLSNLNKNKEFINKNKIYGDKKSLEKIGDLDHPNLEKLDSNYDNKNIIQDKLQRNNKIKSNQNLNTELKNHNTSENLNSNNFSETTKNINNKNNGDKNFYDEKLTDDENKEVKINKLNKQINNKNNFKDSFFANDIQNTISNIVSNINDKLDAAWNKDPGRDNQNAEGNKKAVHIKNSSSYNNNPLMNNDNKNINPIDEKEKYINIDPVNYNSNPNYNTANKLDELKLLISNANKYVEDVDNKYKENQANDIIKTKELTTSNSNNYQSNPIASRGNKNESSNEMKSSSNRINDDFENFLNANSVGNNISNKNISQSIDECDISRSFSNNNGINYIQNFNKILPGQKINNLNYFDPQRSNNNPSENETFQDENKGGLIQENYQRVQNELFPNKNQNIFKNNLQENSNNFVCDKNAHFDSNNLNTNNEIYLPENRFSNVKFENELKNQTNKIQEAINLNKNFVFNVNENEINEEISGNENSIIFNNQVSYNKKGFENKSAELIISNSSSQLNTFARIPVNDKIVNETIGNIKIHDFQTSQINNNLKNSNNTTFGVINENTNVNLENTTTNIQTQTQSDLSNAFNNCISVENKNLDEVKKENLIILSASDFNKNKESKNNLFKEKDFLNKRNFNKYINNESKKNNQKDKHERSSMLISELNNNSNNNSNNSSMINTSSKENKFKSEDSNNNIINNNKDKNTYSKVINNKSKKNNKDSPAKNNFFCINESNKYESDLREEDFDIDIVMNSKGKSTVANRKKVSTSNNNKIKAHNKSDDDQQNSNINSNYNNEKNFQNIRNSNNKTNNSNSELNIILNKVNNLKENLNVNLIHINESFTREDAIITKEIMNKLSDIYNNLGEILKKNDINRDEIISTEIFSKGKSDQIMENYLEKYSNLLLMKVEEKLNSKK